MGKKQTASARAKRSQMRLDRSNARANTGKFVGDLEQVDGPSHNFRYILHIFLPPILSVVEFVGKI